MWRKIKVSASWCSLFLLFFMGIETSLKAPRPLSWSELEDSLSISGAVAVTIIWGLLMLEKLPFSTAGKVCKAVSLCNCAAVCLQLCLSAAAFPSPPQFLTFWSILTTFDRGIEIFRIWSSDNVLCRWVIEERWMSAFLSQLRKRQEETPLLSFYEWRQMPV